ncbi:hypothetical protein CsSME_00049954 [Camellia sinensis var. sinensis]
MSKAGDKKAKTSKVAREASLDPLAQKLQQQRIADEGDPKSSEELFTESGNEKSLDNLIPKSETDFLEYANLISQKLHQYEVPYITTALMDAKLGTEGRKDLFDWLSRQLSGLSNFPHAVNLNYVLFQFVMLDGCDL